MNRTRIDRHTVYILTFGLLFIIACSARDDAPTPRSSQADDAGAAIDPAPTWCAARTVLELKCQRCHGAPPEHGAPFSLVTYDDTRVLDAAGKPRFERIAAAVTSDLMPPLWLELDPEVAPLTDTERTTLLGWCESGAPNAPTDDPDCGSR